MNRRLMIALLSLVLALSLAPGVSFAQEDHLAQAISHTREAVVAGREGKPSSLVEHAKNALEHATVAQREQPNAYVKAGIKRLLQAIKYGVRKNRTVTAVNHASWALRHLEHAPR